MNTKWGILLILPFLVSPLMAQDVSDGTRVSLSRSPANEVPVLGSLVLTCRTTTRGAQMRVEVQRPTDALPVTKTLSSLQSSGDYDVSITDEFLVSVTIKDVTQHNGTSYTCVQDTDSIRYLSDTFRLVLASPVTVTSLVKETKDGVKINVHWQIDAPMELQSCNVLLNCNNTWEDSHIVDGMDRETRFRMRQTDFGSCRVSVKGVRNGVNVAMGTTSVPSEPEASSCFGGFSGWVMLIIATLLCLGLTTILIATMICVCCRRRKQKSVMPHKGDNYSRLHNAYQVKDCEMATPPPIVQQSERSSSLFMA